MIIRLGKLIISTLLSVFVLTSCSDNNTVDQIKHNYDMTGFAKGADVSWLTEMETNGKKFYTTNGNEIECLELLRSMGVNAIRLRVWVNPTGGWNGKKDLLAKALRAKELGFRLMIDFHYSDTWADPGKQTIPVQWKNYNLQEMKQAVFNHTTDVLQTLKNKNINIEWVQVGNETATGMLWEMGRYSNENKNNFAQLINSGYDATKSIYPNAKVILHVDQGNKLGRFIWLFDGLKTNDAKWDIIGMSLYPEDNNWETVTNDCLDNVKILMQRYGSEVVICEVGMSWDSKYAEKFMNKIVTEAKDISGCLGVFYWEPECYNWKQYNKGAFDNNGKPTSALNIFKDK